MKVGYQLALGHGENTELDWVIDFIGSLSQSHFFDRFLIYACLKLENYLKRCKTERSKVKCAHIRRLGESNNKAFEHLVSDLETTLAYPKETDNILYRTELWKALNRHRRTHLYLSGLVSIDSSIVVTILTKLGTPIFPRTACISCTSVQQQSTK